MQGFDAREPNRTVVAAKDDKAGHRQQAPCAIGAKRDEEIAMRAWVILLSAGVATLSVATAAAEEAKTPATAAPVLEASVTKLDCSRPKLPERLATDDDVASLAKQINTYTACATRYLKELRTQAQRHGDLAREEAEASNAAVKEVNDLYATAKQLAQKYKERPAN
jgi:hypothetical protein